MLGNCYFFVKRTFPTVLFYIGILVVLIIATYIIQKSLRLDWVGCVWSFMAAVSSVRFIVIQYKKLQKDVGFFFNIRYYKVNICFGIFIFLLSTFASVFQGMQYYKYGKGLASEGIDILFPMIVSGLAGIGQAVTFVIYTRGFFLDQQKTNTTLVSIASTSDGSVCLHM